MSRNCVLYKSCGAELRNSDVDFASTRTYSNQDREPITQITGFPKNAYKLTERLLLHNCDAHQSHPCEKALHLIMETSGTQRTWVLHLATPDLPALLFLSRQLQPLQPQPSPLPSLTPARTLRATMLLLLFALVRISATTELLPLPGTSAT